MQTGEPETEPSLTEPSLYKRLGGYDAIAAIVSDLFQLLRDDPRFSRFGLGRSLDSKIRVQQLTIEQICALAGGPCTYLGRDMKTSHRGLSITPEEWQANLDLTRKALAKNNIGDREQSEFIALFERFRSEIVEAPPTSG